MIPVIQVTNALITIFDNKFIFRHFLANVPAAQPFASEHIFEGSYTNRRQRV